MGGRRCVVWGGEVVGVDFLVMSGGEEGGGVVVVIRFDGVGLAPLGSSWFVGGPSSTLVHVSGLSN